MNYRIIVHEPDEPVLGTVILLTGRGGRAETFIAKYKNHLHQSRLIAIQPIKQWYPLPNGANDQAEAVAGIAQAIPELKDCLDKIINQLSIKYKDIAVVGFSAGAVMALKLATHCNLEFAFIALHNGALLEPESLPESSIKTPFMLIHSKDDDCFSWDERYIPMKNALIQKNYNLFFIEKSEDKHLMTQEDIYFVSCYIAEKFNYMDAIPYRNVDFDDECLV